MKRFKSIFQVLMALLLVFGALGNLPVKPVSADATAQTLPFSQDWTTTSLITTNDDWSGVPGIVGYRGDNLTAATGTDPQLILLPDSPGVVDVNANQTNPITFTTGGVTEFDGVVALTGSGTADAPYLLINLNTTGNQNIAVSYLVRDIDASIDNAAQQVALHYRVGSTGDFTNVPAAYLGDASAGPSLTLDTPVSVTLPAAADNQLLVQLRIMTTNAVGNDEWVGIDDISVTVVADLAPTVIGTTPFNGGSASVSDNIVITFSEAVTVADGWYDISCGTSGAHTASVTDADPIYTLDPALDFTGGETCTVTIDQTKVNDDDTDDATADFMTANYVFSFTTEAEPTLPPSVASVTPLNGATGQERNTSFIVEFDQAVTLTDPWFSVACPASTGITFGASVIGNTYTITPSGLLAYADTCTLTITAANVRSTATDLWMALDFVSAFTVKTDDAPALVNSVPANSAVNVAKDSPITLTFNEAVDVSATGITFSCSITGDVPFAVAMAPDDATTWNITHDTLLQGGQTCTLTVPAASVTDQDLLDPPDTIAADIVISFTPTSCGDAITPIYTIQGAGDVNAFPDQIVTTEGVVTGDFQNNASLDSGNLNGFFIQDPTGDANDLTSDGIFAYYTPVDVQVGDMVRVTGKVVEYKGLTEISPVGQVLVCGPGTVPDPIVVNLPLSDPLIMEQYEGMLLTFPDTLTIAEYFNYDRFGHIVLTNGRYMTFTAWQEPDVDLFAANNLDYSKNMIVLDDGISTQNPAVLRHPDGTTFTKEHYFRGGDYVTGVTGALDYNSDDGYYRLQPTAVATYTALNPRPTVPEVNEGDLKVASFNVLNYFITLDLGPDICGPLGNMECRGADTADELTRQRYKLLDALLDIDADVFGLMEIENDRLTGEGDAVADLVAGLNDVLGAGTYAYIDTGTIGTDAIKQAILYKPGKVTPVGEYKILDSTVDPRFIDVRNRPALAQTFSDMLTGKTFTVAVNHLKSKGSTCDGDPDLLDGAGNCNITRRDAALALVDWLADETVFPGSQNTLIIGDLNSYDKEDPIDAIKLGSDDTAGTSDDYLDMIFEVLGDYAYGYVFDGKIGYLDYALANMELAGNVVDVNFWHINADESDVFDYDMTFKPAEQEALYTVDPYRSSDHDPVIITLRFSPEAEDDSYTTDENPLDVAAPGVLANDYDTEGDSLIVSLVTPPTNGSLTLNANGSFSYVPALNFSGLDSFVYKAADENYYDIATVSITVNPVNDAPVAVADAYTTAKNTELIVVAPGVLTNDTDVDLDTLTVELVADVANGTLALSADGSFTYTPFAGYFGTDTFTYRVYDGTSYSEPADVVVMTQKKKLPKKHDSSKKNVTERFSTNVPLSGQ